MPSRAVLLLRKVIATRTFDREALAAALAVSVEMVDTYEAADVPMPLDAQPGLATFATDHVPLLARAGHALAGRRPPR